MVLRPSSFRMRQTWTGRRAPSRRSSASSAPSSARCGSTRARRSPSTATAASSSTWSAGLRRYPARRAGAPGHALPPLLRHQAARLGRPLAADRARHGRARRPGRRRTGRRSASTARSGSRCGTSSPTAAASRLTPPELTPDRWGDWAGAIRTIAAMALEPRTRAPSAPTTS